MTYPSPRRRTIRQRPAHNRTQNTPTAVHEPGHPDIKRLLLGTTHDRHQIERSNSYHQHHSHIFN
jgi:hypothetical protein